MFFFFYIPSAPFYDITMYMYIADTLVNLYVLLKGLDVSLAFTNDLRKKTSHYYELQTSKFYNKYT